MSEKFREVVKTPEETAKKLREFIEGKKPVDYVRKKRMQKKKRGIKGKHEDLADNSAIFALGLAKWTAWLAAGGSQFLLTLARWLTLDNKFLRDMEKNFSEKPVKLTSEGKPKNFSLWRKNNPNVYAHILWLFGLAAVSGAGYFAAEYEDGDFQELYEKVISFFNKDKKQSVGCTYGEFLNIVKPLTPFLIDDLIAKEGVHLDKNGLHTPYRDSGGVPTIGFGSTVLKDGTRVKMKTPPITNEEAYELARCHIEDIETYFILYCYFVSQPNVQLSSKESIFGISSIIYNAGSDLIEDKNDKNHQNRFAILRKQYKKDGLSLSSDFVREQFDKYPILKPTSFGNVWLAGKSNEKIGDALGNFLRGGRGMYWRRWLEAGSFTDEIKPEDLLYCPVNGVYEFFESVGGKKQTFFKGKLPNRKANRETYKKFKEWLKNPVTKRGESLRNHKKIADILPPEIRVICEGGVKNFDESALIELKERQGVDFSYRELYENVKIAYSKEDYKSAAEQLENMLTLFPDNALLHNDLAATYNHLGRFEEAIEQTNEVLNRIGDERQFAAAQYNAGVAYEKMGKLEQALEKYNLAVKNGNSSVKKDVNRVKELISGKRIDFTDAVKKIKVRNSNKRSVLENNNENLV